MDKTIETLEEEKKVLAQKKKFKDAKRVKDTLELKTQKRDSIQVKINEIKQTKEQAEETKQNNLRALQKFVAQKTDEEMALREAEYKILVSKLHYLVEIESDVNSVKLATDGNEEPEGKQPNESEIVKNLTREIVEFEEKYGFSKNSDSENESKLSIENKTPVKKLVKEDSEESAEKVKSFELKK